MTAFDVRVGLGVDAHALGASAPLVLAGVEFPGEPGLIGHSDGDVLAHAVTDAILGAAGLSDIGELFPSDDERWQGADSIELLASAYREVRDAGFELVNADCVLIGQRPRVAPRRALSVDAACVTVRATTTDRLGFTGREEGLAAQAVALVRRCDGA
jgi:2-C-methyl-D-erythritol 2,4-cyclodiphosphate synthase